MHARRPLITLVLALALALLATACGGDDGDLGTFGGSSDDGGATSTDDSGLDDDSSAGDDGSGGDDSSGDDGSGGDDSSAGDDGSGGDDSSGDDGSGGDDSAQTTDKFWVDPEDLTFDPAGLAGDPIDPAALTDDGKIGGVPEAYPAALYDSCAALAPTAVTQIANDYDVLGVPEFSAVSVGPACRYRSQTHIIDVIVHDADTVATIAENLVPIAAGDIFINPGTLDGRVQIYSEDSFGIETPYAWVLADGDRGVVVRNVGGTGLLIGNESTEQGWEAMAVAAFDGAAGLTAGDVPPDTPTQADPCSVFEPADIEATFGIAVEERDLGGSCLWEPNLSAFSIEVTVGNPDTEPFGATEELAPNVFCCDFLSQGVVYHDPGVASFSVTVWYPEGEGVSNQNNDVAVDIINAIAARLG